MDRVLTDSDLEVILGSICPLDKWQRALQFGRLVEEAVIEKQQAIGCVAPGTPVTVNGLGDRELVAAMRPLRSYPDDALPLAHAVQDAVLGAVRAELRAPAPIVEVLESTVTAGLVDNLKKAGYCVVIVNTIPGVRVASAPLTFNKGGA